MSEEIKIDMAEVMELHAQGLKAGQIVTELGVDITAAKMGKMISEEKAKTETPTLQPATTPKTVKAEVVGDTNVGKGIHVMTAEEYEKYSLENGRTRFGGKKGEKRTCTIEELRAYINSKWTPSRIMEKYQIDEKEFEQLVMKLSVTEMREKAQRIRYNLDANIFL